MQLALDPVRSGDELYCPQTKRWLAGSDITSPTVVFVHGFTAHGQHFETRLEPYIRSEGFTTAVFNYDSFNGIERAAGSLLRKLERVSRPLKDRGCVLVGHSMGGLVARSLPALFPETSSQILRGIVTLGTPHQGALDGQIVRALTYLGEWMSGVNPYAHNPACQSAIDLTSRDSDSFLSRLAIAERESSMKGLPLMSISGGLAYIEALEPGKRPIRQYLMNQLVQRTIDHLPNDGLVAEYSADIRNLQGLTNTTHENQYPDFGVVNHTYLCQNSDVADLLSNWLKTIF